MEKNLNIINIPNSQPDPSWSGNTYTQSTQKTISAFPKMIFSQISLLREEEKAAFMKKFSETPFWELITINFDNKISIARAFQLAQTLPPLSKPEYSLFTNDPELYIEKMLIFQMQQAAERRNIRTISKSNQATSLSQISKTAEMIMNTLSMTDDDQNKFFNLVFPQLKTVIKNKFIGDKFSFQKIREN